MPSQQTEKDYIQQLFNKKASCDDNSTTLTQTLMKDINTGFKGEHKYIFELLQNADDAAYDNRSQTITFSVLSEETKQYLIVAHQGQHFTNVDVEKICDNAQQKFDDKLKNIQKTGYKGIGFKAIFSISDCIYVFSQKYTFRFDKSYSQWQQTPKNHQYPWPIIPIWTEEHEIPAVLQGKIDFEQVNFIVEIKPEVNIEEELTQILKNPTMMLFLRKTKCIKIELNGQTTSLELKSENDKVEALYKNGDLLSRWYKYQVGIKIDAKIKEVLQKLTPYECPERMKEVTSSTITFAAELDKNDSILKNSNSLLFCYLPTAVRVPFPYLVNADFLLNSERTHLQDNSWNAYLLKCIAFMQIKWLIELNKIPSLRFQILKLLTKPGQIENDKFTNAFNQGTEYALEKLKFIPSNSQPTTLLDTNTAIIDTTDFYSKLTSITPPKYLVSYELQDIKILQDSPFRVKTMGPNEICEQLPHYANKYKTIEFQKQLFNFLRTKLKQYPWNKLPRLAIALNHQKNTVSPEQIYLPIKILNKKLLPPKEIKINYLHPKLLKDQDYIGSISQLGAKKATPIELFRGVVLKFIQSPELNKENIVSITQYIFQLFLEKLLEDKDYSILKNLKILTKRNTLLQSDLTYLADEYQPDLSLESEAKEQDMFVSLEYINAIPEMSQEWSEFFVKIGAKKDVYFFTRKYKISDAKREKGKIFNEYLFYLHSRGMTTKNIQEDHNIENFLDCNIINYITSSAFAKIFWDKVIQNWQQIKASYPLRYLTHGYQHYLISLNYLQYVVLNLPCVPATDGKLYSAKKVYSPNFKNLQNHIPVANIAKLTDEQAKYFSFHQKLDFITIITILEQMKKANSRDIQQYFLLFKSLLDLSLTNDQMSQLQAACFKLPAQNGELKLATELRCFCVGDKPAPRSGYWLKEFPKKIKREELIKVSKIFNIPIIDKNKIRFTYNQATEDHNVNTIIADRLAIIARVEATTIGQDERKILISLYAKFRNLLCYSAHRLSYDHGGHAADPLYAHLVQNKLYFKGKWNNTMTIGPFCAELGRYFQLSESSIDDLREILTITDDEIDDWLDTHGCSSSPLIELSSIEDEIEETEISDNEFTDNIESQVDTQNIKSTPSDQSSPMRQNTFTELENDSFDEKHKQPETKPISRRSSSSNTSNVRDKKEISDRGEKTEKNTFIEVDVNSIDYSSIKVKKASPTAIQSSDQSENDTFDKIHNQSEEKATSRRSSSLNTLDDRDKKEIGDWGEKLVYNYLLDHYKNKEKYKECELTETERGFKLVGHKTDNSSLNLEVIWHNKDTESGKPKDFTIKKNEKKCIIEVKSTSSPSKTTFFLSSKEYELLQKKKDCYSFFRVYNAGKQSTRIEKIKNPAKKIEDGSLSILRMEIQQKM